jgi:hypothetical protein
MTQCIMCRHDNERYGGMREHGVDRLIKD